LLWLTDTYLYIYICLKHFGMANIKQRTPLPQDGINKCGRERMIRAGFEAQISSSNDSVCTNVRTVLALTENFTHTNVMGLQSFPIIYTAHILATFQKEDLLIPLNSRYTSVRRSLHRRVLIQNQHKQT